MDDHAPQLKRELGLRDITSSLSPASWARAGFRAAHAGQLHHAVAAGALLFMVPLAIAVSALSVKYPGAGGLYLWTRNDFGRWHGFLCFIVYWIGIAFWFPSAACST